MNELISFATLPDDPPGSETIRIKDTVRQMKGSLKAKDEAIRNAQARSCTRWPKWPSRTMARPRAT